MFHLNRIPKNQIYHKLDKTLEFATIKMQNTLGNHEHFDRVVTGLWVKGSAQQICWDL